MLTVANLRFIVAFIAVLSGLLVQPVAHAATPEPSAHKERLVLMPLRLEEGLKPLQGAMETALVNGLQEKYVVFAGEQVSAKAKQIFSKEATESQKVNRVCDGTRCMQDVAMAFQAELLAIANITRQEDGYFIAISIQNIFDNKVEFSKSVPCRGCDAYKVVDKLNELFTESTVTTAAEPAKPAGLYLGVQLGSAGKIKGVDNVNTYGALLGYHLSDSYSLELGYVPLYSKAKADTLANTLVTNNIGGKFTLSSAFLSVQYGIAMSASTKLVGKLGLHSSSYNLDSGSVSLLKGSTSGALLGLKAQYDISKSVSLRGGVDLYSLGGALKGTVGNTGVDLILNF